MDLCRLRDDLGTQARAVPETMPKADVAVLLESYADEVALVLERCGVIPVRPEPLTRFDPRLHQAAGAVPVASPDLDQAIESVVSDGYAQRATGKPLALPRVIVYRHVATAGRSAWPSRDGEADGGGPPGPGVPDVKLGPRERKAFASTLELARRLPRDHPGYPAAVVQAASQLVLLGLADRDPALVGQAIAMVTDAAGAGGLAAAERPRVLSLHGYALQARYWLNRDARDLAAAIGWLEEAQRAAGEQPGSPYATEIGQLLADARRLSDRTAKDSGTDGGTTS